MGAEFYNPEGGPYTARVFRRYVDLLADSGVDTFLINPNVQVAMYPSRIVPTCLDGYRRGDRDFFRAHARAAGVPADRLENFLEQFVSMTDRYLDLTEAGVDWITEIAAACRRRCISPWISVRMNDHHASADPGSHLNSPLFREARGRLSIKNITPKNTQSTAFIGLNYALPEVRNYMLSMIRELVMDYDYEGIELDWLRSPVCCAPDADEQNRRVMTEWLAVIRELTEAKAKATGRPYVLGLRMPGNLGQLRSIGLDVKAYAQAGLIDFVCPSNSYQTSWDMPYDRLRAELGDKIALYGVIEAVPNWLNAYSPAYPNLCGPRLLGASAPLLRGNAAGKLAMGADGIEQFNFFCADVNWPELTIRADYSALGGLADLERLRGQEKQYALSTWPTPPWVFPHFETPEQLPVVIEPGRRQVFKLAMCAESAKRGHELIIQIVYEKKRNQPPLALSFNGGWPVYDGQTSDQLLFPVPPYTNHRPEYQALNFRLPVAEIQEGWNEIMVYHGLPRPAGGTHTPDDAIRLVSVELAIKTPEHCSGLLQ